MYREDIENIPRVRENGTLDFDCVLEIMEYAPEYALSFLERAPIFSRLPELMGPVAREGW